MVLDAAGPQGPGKGTSANALDMGVPAPTVAEAVFSRCLSAVKEERVAASKILKGPGKKYKGSKKELIAAVMDALYCSKICSYAQGFQLMRAAQEEYKWKLDFGEIAQIWRGGCIIRASFLQKITEAYARDPKLGNLLLESVLHQTIKKAQKNWRKAVALGVEHGISLPTFRAPWRTTMVTRSALVAGQPLQAQRDYFGAHTYERVDQPRGKFFHLDWLHQDRRSSDLSSPERWTTASRRSRTPPSALARASPRGRLTGGLTFVPLGPAAARPESAGHRGKRRDETQG